MHVGQTDKSCQSHPFFSLSFEIIFLRQEIKYSIAANNCDYDILECNGNRIYIFLENVFIFYYINVVRNSLICYYFFSFLRLNLTEIVNVALIMQHQKLIIN